MSWSRDEGSKDGSVASLSIVSSGLRGAGGGSVDGGAGGWESGWDVILVDEGSREWRGGSQWMGRAEGN